MAYFADDYINCSECGCSSFKEEQLVMIENIYTGFKVKRQINEAIPDQFLVKEISYICTKCGTALDI